MAQHEALLKPLTIKGLTIRNRFLSTSHSPGYATAGRANDRYIRYHEEKARGGIGLTQFGGATATSIENSIDYGQLDGSTDAAIDSYTRFAEAIHRHGAACMVQLRHGGRRERWDMANWLPAYAPSPRREPVHRSFPVEMDKNDIARVREDYAQAVLRAKKGGLDGVEVSCANQTLIDQFWSPDVNARKDDYGGSIENRLRFGLEILTRARELVGADFVMGIRMSGDEMVASGLSQGECVEIAQRMAASGLVDFVSVMAAQGRDYRSNANSYIGMDAGPAPYLHLASAIKAEIDLPIFHATRITDLATAARAVEEGHVDMVGMTRAFISDPHLARKLIEGREDDIRQCVGAAYCVDRVVSARDTLCIQNVLTSREADLPQDLPRAETRRKVVVIGAGPAGLEAARASAERGHDVVLFEREDRPGGQINLAAKVAWRESLTGVTRWLDQQTRKLGVDLRFGTEATAEAVRAEMPDVVIVATGGRPNLGAFAGRDLAVSSWDILSGAVAPAETVLLIDDHGGDQGPGCAEFMAERGSRVEIATPERQLLSELGMVNFTPYLRRLYAREVVISPDLRLESVEREGNKLVAVLRNEFSLAEEERLVDQVVAEHGTLPDDSLFQALRRYSTNDGETDLQALVHARPQAAAHNPDGAFRLFRIGDAWTSRNIHAAIYDAKRLCMAL